MNIESFEVWNFKSIKYSGKISLPKLTILIGPNSAGKSSIGQSLLLMQQTFGAEEPTIPLILNGPLIQLGEYSDFIFGKKESLPFSIRFNFEAHKKIKAYECDVCSKAYDSKGWYLRHVKEKHKDFWKDKKEDISTELYHLPKKPSLRFQYALNSITGTIFLQQLEMENPSYYYSQGLNLASIKLTQFKNNRIKIEATSKDGIKIFTTSHKIPKNTSIINPTSFIYLFRYFTQTVESRYFFTPFKHRRA